MPDFLSEHLKIARDELMAARALLRHEIATYPVPIAGCDKQFNHIISQLARVRSALNALEDDAR